MSIADHSIAAKIAAISSSFSPYPPSFDNNGWLYFASLVSLLSITMYGAVTGGWMIRDIWADRFTEHPRSPAFLFRLMVAIVSWTAFVRCLPEVAYMTCYGEMTGATMSRILAVKRIADVIALPSVAGWQAILTMIYPYVILALKSRRLSPTSEIDPLSVWPRLARPAVIFVTILVIASLMAVAKGAMGHHAG